jgi:hypothetical protein
MTFRIGIIGDFNGNNPTHVATNSGILHAAEALGEPSEAVWLATDEPQEFEHFQGLLCSPGSPIEVSKGRWPAFDTRGKTTFHS